MDSNQLPDLPENLTAKEKAKELNEKIMEKANILYDRCKILLAEKNDIGYMLTIGDILTHDTPNIDTVVRDMVCDKLNKAGYEVQQEDDDDGVDSIFIVNPMAIYYKTAYDK